MIRSRQQLLLWISDFATRATVAVGGTLGVITLAVSGSTMDLLWFLAMLVLPVALVLVSLRLLAGRTITVPAPGALALGAAAVLANAMVFGPFDSLYLPLCGVVVGAAALRLAVVSTARLRPYIHFERN